MCWITMIERLFSSSNYLAAKQMLDAASLRQEAIANNIANIETPGYKRMDLQKDFAEQFASHVRGGTLKQAPAPSLVEDSRSTSLRKDGNNVELDKELLAMSKNGLEYEAMTEFVSGSLRQLRMAITGRTV